MFFSFESICRPKIIPRIGMAAEEVAGAKLTLPESSALATAWEGESSLRYRVLDAEHHCLTRWSRPMCVGQPSVANMKLNTRLLEVLAQVWVSVQEYPHAVPIDYLRKEA